MAPRPLDAGSQRGRRGASGRLLEDPWFAGGVDQLVEQRHVRRLADRLQQLLAHLVALPSRASSRAPRGPCDRSRAASAPSNGTCRAGPRCRARHRARRPTPRSRSRSEAAHSGSSTSRNVRSAERTRRVATLAWCTLFGSSPAEPRRHGGAAAPPTSRAPVGRRRLRRRARRARAPRGRAGPRRAGRAHARAWARCRRGRRRPAEPLDEDLRELLICLGVELDLQLPEPARDAPSVHHRHLIVGHHANGLPASSAIWTPRRTVCNRATGPVPPRGHRRGPGRRRPSAASSRRRLRSSPRCGRAVIRCPEGSLTVHPFWPSPVPQAAPPPSDPRSGVST